MARTNQDGKDIKQVLEWLCRRRLPDSELAAALDMPPTNYSRRKEADDFPTYEDLTQFASYFGLSGRALQIAFGFRGRDELVLLGDDELQQYVEQGGGRSPITGRLPALGVVTRSDETCAASPHRARIDRRIGKAGG